MITSETSDTPDHSEAKPNTVLLSPEQLAIDGTEPAEGDTVTLERVEATMRGTRGGKLLFEITSVAGEPVAAAPAPVDEEAEVRDMAAAADQES